MSAEIRASYEELLGHVPETVEHRSALATEAGHPASVDAIEAFRVELLHRNQLDPRTQQLVHFALLIRSRSRRTGIDPRSRGPSQRCDQYGPVRRVHNRRRHRRHACVQPMCRHRSLDHTRLKVTVAHTSMLPF